MRSMRFYATPDEVLNMALHILEESALHNYGRLESLNVDIYNDPRVKAC